MNSTTLKDVIDNFLKERLRRFSNIYPKLEEMLLYHFGFLDGNEHSGKRLRPQLCLLTYTLFDQDFTTILPLASALEILHNYTLIHDDIEDNSYMRHSKSALWQVYGLAQALNTGDFLHSLAIETLHNLDLEIIRKHIIINHFMETARLVTVGQYLDLLYQTRKTISMEQYLEMISLKTGRLIESSVVCGAVAALGNSALISLFEEIGKSLGLAFQIRDDYLGIWADPKHSGKPTGLDLQEKKKSYPVVLAMEKNDRFQEIWNSKPLLGQPEIDELTKEMELSDIQNEILQKLKVLEKDVQIHVDQIQGIDDNRKENFAQLLRLFFEI